MADLRRLFEDLGYADVRTLLNSGNVVFTVRQPAVVNHAARVEEAVAEHLGVRTRVVVLTRKELVDAVESNPLMSIADDPSRLLVVAFADAKAIARVKPLLKQRWTPETLALGRRVAYLWCARGIGVSPLWATVNRAIGDTGTARNIATMTKMLALISQSAST